MWSGVDNKTKLGQMVQSKMLLFHGRMLFLLFFFIFVCFFEVSCPTREFFAHKETSTLKMKDFKFQPILGTHVHSAWSFHNEGSLACHTYYNRSISVWCHLRGTMTLTPVAVRLAMGLSLHVLRVISVTVGIWTPNLPHGSRTL